MCGIIGIINYDDKSKYIHEMKKVLTNMMIVGSVRGRDSTGMITVPYDIKDPVEYFRTTLEGYNAIELPPFKRFVFDYDKYKFFVGHHRSATKGKISVNNAHPFQHEGKFGTITMVHNGTLTNKYDLPSHTSFDTDSEAICHSLANFGVEETIGKIKGSFCLVWHSTLDDTLNFIRNNERPMSFVTEKDKGFTLFASEGSMLKYITSRHCIDVTKCTGLKVGVLNKVYSDTYGNVERIPIDLAPATPVNTGYGYNSQDSEYYKKHRWDIPLGRYVLKEAYKEVPKKETKILEFKPKLVLPEKVSTPNYVGSSVPAYVIDINTVPGKKNTVWRVESVMAEDPFLEIFYYTKNLGKLTDSSEVLLNIVSQRTPDGANEVRLTADAYTIVDAHGEMLIQGPNNIKITSTEFTKLVQDGCQGCGDNIYPSDAGSISWTNDKTAVCKECTKEYTNWGMLERKN